MARTHKVADTTTIYRAKESFTTVIDGQQINVVGLRTTVRAGHPLLDGRGQFFEPITVDFDVEPTAENA